MNHDTGYNDVQTEPTDKSVNDLDVKKPARVELRGVTFFDFAVIVPILALSFFWLFRSPIEAETEAASASQAVLYFDGRPANRFVLNRGQKIQLLEGKISLEIQNQSIRILQSDCPHQFCVQQGWIRNAGESIICIPYKLVIEVQASGQPIVDAVVY